jgi:hypothetical protein
MDYGRETITIFEINQPFCSREYGDGAVSFAVDSADFDGTNDYMTRGASLSGVADSKSGILSAWVRLDGGNGVTGFIFNAPIAIGDLVNRFELQRNNNNNFFLVGGRNAAGTQILKLESSGGYVAGATWRHVLASWDLATAAGHLYINDVSDITSSTLTNDTIDYTVADFVIGARGDGASKLNGCLAELYFAPGQYLDFSVAANRRKFISAIGKPVPLGTTGVLPTGTAPLVYQHLDNLEAVTFFRINRGTGGNFSIVGVLDPASSNPSDGVGCQAILGTSGIRKCFNSRFTCQDPENYTPGVLTLRFGRGQEDTLQYGPLIPSMIELETTPASINLAAMDKNTSALGSREVVTIQFQDHKHSDHLVDKYRLQRYTGEAQST